MKLKRHNMGARGVIALILSYMVFKINYSKEEILTYKENLLVTIILLFGILICWTYPYLKKSFKKIYKRFTNQ